MSAREQTVTDWRRTFPQRPRKPTGHPLGRYPDLWVEPESDRQLVQVLAWATLASALLAVLAVWWLAR